ncbi:adenylate/guanylate cyclase domain-containing protein [Nocardioides montaniterrae]
MTNGAGIDQVSPFGHRILGPRGQDPERMRRRVQLLLTVLLVSTNTLGGLAVCAINLWAVPLAPLTHRSFVALWIGLPIVIGASAVIGTVWGTRHGVRTLAWAIRNQRPTDEQRRRSLRVPLDLTLVFFALWMISVAVAVVTLIFVQPERTFVAAMTGVIGGVVTSGIGYLFCEFSLRPVSARAMAGMTVTGAVRGVGVGPRMVLFWIVGSGAPIVGLLLVTVIALNSNRATVDQLGIVTVATCAVVLLTGYLLTDLNARATRAPIESLRRAMRKIANGDFDSDVEVYDGTELGALQSGFNDMLHGLRERDKLRDLFSRHVGTEVAEAAAAGHTGEIALIGETRNATVLFVDLTGSTTYAASRSAADVVAMLNRFFGVVVDEVDRNHGLVNKFMGDAVLAVFGAPTLQRDHAADALAAARSIAARLAAEVPEVGAGIGVATGTVVAGNVGHEQRYEYTVIGDAVNSAARLTELAKEIPGSIVASWSSVAAARATGSPEAGLWIDAGATTLRGRSVPTQLAIPNPAGVEAV